MQQMTGLVLEGGGTRAIYTSGVLDRFLDAGITFPYVIGVSAGSCNGTSFLGKCRGRQHDLNVHYVNDKRYMGWQHFFRNGNYLNMDWIFNELSYEILPLNVEEFEKAGRMTAVVTNADTGKAEYLPVENIRDACPMIAASCAIPMVTRGVRIGDKTYFDGGVADSIPVRRALEDGCTRCVVVLTQHDGYQKQPMRKGFETMRRRMKRYPNLMDAMANRYLMYNEQLREVKRLEQEGRIFVIRPSRPLECGTMEKEVPKLESVYRLGFQDAQNQMERLQAFLEAASE
ncbi:MAG: patatin family protein [Clostridiales bacterium]|nr:patatin family protein [Clostridiales bacterium]